MEPAGRYFWDDLGAFLKPAFKDCRTALRTMWKSIIFLVCVLPLGLAFSIAALRRRKREK
jgi:hypothetical protein